MPSYDVMPDVQLYQPAEIDDALTGLRTIELLALDAMTTPAEIREAGYSQ